MLKITVASGKGGTGKTTVSTNLADFLSQNFSTVLVDLDVEEPNSGIFFRGSLVHKEVQYKYVPEWIEKRCTDCGLCSEVCNFNSIVRLHNLVMVFPQLCHSCFACSELCPVEALPMKPKRIGELRHFRNKKYDLVESSLDIGEEQAVPLISLTKQYIDSIAAFENSIVIFDSPPGTSCPMIEANKDSDYIILVTEPTPFGLNDLSLAVDTLEKLGKNYGVVVNRSGIGNRDVFEYCSSKNIDVIAEIPHKREIAEHYSNGKLLYDVFPEVNHEMEKIFRHIRHVNGSGLKQ